jgi:hypothetical protein
LLGPIYPFSFKKSKIFSESSCVISFSTLFLSLTSKPANETDNHKRIMYYIRGTEPSNTDPVFDEIMEKENKY